MPDETAFDTAEFLGLARSSKRDPYRLGLFARRFEPDERAAAVLPVAGGTPVITDRRLILFTAHLKVDGAWNVREFTGYAIAKEIPLAAIAGVRRSTSSKPPGTVDILHVSTRDGSEEFVLSHGPERVVPDEDVARAVALLTGRSPSPVRHA